MAASVDLPAGLRLNLDTETHSPLYRQLYDLLRLRIRDGKLKPGFSFPSERELTDVWNLGRTTVRQALDLLEGDGLIGRMRGVGPFVQEPRHWRRRRDVLNAGIVSFDGLPFYLE